MESVPGISGVAQEIACSGCGAHLAYVPGTTTLTCQHCGSANHIEQEKQTVVEESDYTTFLEEKNTADTSVQVHVAACRACGAATQLQPNVTSDLCPFCGTPLLVDKETILSQVKPRYLLPFGVDGMHARTLFTKWVLKLWFAPRDLKRYAETAERLAGLYIPYWTYDSSTESRYTGQRGTNHVQHYSATVNGKRVTQTRTVIRWTPASGCIRKLFDDVLVVASTSLPEKYAARLEPWDLEHLVEYNEQYLAGFKTETYRISVEQGFEKAKVTMDAAIRECIKREIGGDHQRISSVHTQWENITFKHILLPVWLSAYSYNGKVYRFMVNGRTGEVQGERPWSVIKIALASFSVLAFLAGVYFLLRPYVN